MIVYIIIIYCVIVPILSPLFMIIAMNNAKVFSGYYEVIDVNDGSHSLRSPFTTKLLANARYTKQISKHHMATLALLALPVSSCLCALI
jgi:hypothetical protein